MWLIAAETFPRKPIKTFCLKIIEMTKIKTQNLISDHVQQQEAACLCCSSHSSFIFSQHPKIHGNYNYRNILEIFHKILNKKLYGQSFLSELLWNMNFIQMCKVYKMFLIRIQWDLLHGAQWYKEGSRVYILVHPVSYLASNTHHRCYALLGALLHELENIHGNQKDEKG